ncbi:hypothetical protein ACWT_4663 [Actinoplanes sp. SE50]|uniref:hypothetical protein n=1 Tax=unclassified Actinoplanes TaxID=2626549 RepID=UPI00023EBBD0|nr:MULTISPECIES: hypothetical protein [unclassified Actinoplanes]AEV85685.1 hypothetical protein ACPL_4794 [Actinoplanes sp. SE50/110]ATO84078.1 hypothetical protein ACWT_4663 [Actinoplanes sp. SE50]SLM01488.1 hypothetical protein ACSP50_4724 [Actinoplanes sp. SE50/110]
MTEQRRNRAVGGRPPAARHRRPAPATRLTLESTLVGLVIGLLVVAPWTRPGYLLLLDWVAGPHTALTPGLYGLDPAALDALPYRLVTHALRAVVGAGATSWLMILAYFPIAAGGVSGIAGGSRWRRHPAAVFACVNPFVVERLHAGHVPFLLSVALLCPLTASALHARRRGGWFAARPAGWYALAISVGAHAAWLGGMVLLAVALLPRPGRRHLARTAVIVVSAGCVYAYAAAVVATAILTVRVSDEDLEVYATYAGASGLTATVATLRGFWRGGSDSSPQLALGVVPGVILVVATVAGLIRLCRRDRAVGAPLAAVTATGLLLGAGITGPLGPVYRIAFDTLPLFHAMREQQKWAALAMIGYAVGFGAAAEAVALRCRAGRPVAPRAVAVGAALALAGMTATVSGSLFWGLGGSVGVSHYPPAWYTADRIMGDGDESMLFLPWHQYQPFTFTAARSVATPAGAFFRRPVLSSDAVELGPVRSNSSSYRMAYLDRLIAAGGGGSFGRLIAPLGVRYVALARDRESGTYAWLDRQPDLEPVLRTAALDLYRVTVSGIGRVVSARDGDYAALLAWAARGRLGTEAVISGAGGGTVPSAASGGLRRVGSTRWRVAAGEAGWVVLPEEWSAGWTAGDQVTRRTVAGTVAVHAGSGAFTVRYAPWKWLRLGLAASLLTLVALLGAGLVEHRRELSPRFRRRPGGSGRRGAGPGS